MTYSADECIEMYIASMISNGASTKLANEQQKLSFAVADFGNCRCFSGYGQSIEEVRDVFKEIIDGIEDDDFSVYYEDDTEEGGHERLNDFFNNNNIVVDIRPQIGGDIIELSI